MKSCRSGRPPRCRPPGTRVLDQRKKAAAAHAPASAAKVASRSWSLMRVAVISDIHANLHALEAVAEAIEHESPDAVWCLGDLVGYGPQPNDCCAWAAERTQLCLAGNHDLGVLGTLDLDDFSPDAAAAATWTRKVLDEAARAYLAGLASSAERDGVGPLPRQPARPGLGVRAHLGGGSRRDPRLGCTTSRSSATAMSRSRSPTAAGRSAATPQAAPRST